MAHRGARALVAAIVCSMMPACGGPMPADPGTSPENASARGAVLYARQCAICHGKSGEGTSGPPLRGNKRGRDDLIALIDATMPKGDPGRCKGQCAADVADYILAGFTAPALQCGEAGAVSSRRLRLLTRREYLATVSDLVAPQSGPPAPCDRYTFTYDPRGRTLNTVHVAGNFNNWPSTVAGGGWRMNYDGARKVWSVEHTLAPGTYAYKFVLNESEWVQDPANPVGTPDGFGGQNSVLTLRCSDAGSRLAYDPTTNFPPETRPENFAYDDNADARVVTPVHVTEYLKSAQQLAKTALDNLGTILPNCDFNANKADCADRFVRNFGLRAFRRPLTDTEINRYKALLLNQTAWKDGVSLAVQSFLVSSSFLYRSELGEMQQDGTYRLSAYETASALSYLFWGTMPDQALFDAAANGELLTAAGVEKHARRLLADARSRDMVGLFALQWLGVEGVGGANKNNSLYPGWTDDVRKSMGEETRRFVAELVAGGATFDQLFTADYSYLNQSLASLYGAPAVNSTALVKSAVPDARKAGVLAHGSVMASYAYPDQTSPVRRGLFVRRNLLCQEFPPPLPNAGSVPTVNPNSTTRERFHQHTQNPVCAACHNYIDPVGFGFERFDAIGRTRDTENGRPVDSTADMNDLEGLGSGTHASFASPVELGKMLAQSPSARECFTRQVYRFARGAVDGPADLCALAAISNQFQASGWKLPDLLLAVAKSPDFVRRK